MSNSIRQSSSFSWDTMSWSVRITSYSQTVPSDSELSARAWVSSSFHARTSDRTSTGDSSGSTTVSSALESLLALLASSVLALVSAGERVPMM